MREGSRSIAPTRVNIWLISGKKEKFALFQQPLLMQLFASPALQVTFVALF